MCAPHTGASLRLHLQIEVAPTGRILRTRLTNLDPIPSEVSRCVDKVAGALTPPAFDASESETFALTIVL